MSAPLRVLHLNTERGYRGGERQVLFLLEHLASLGVECHLAALPDGELWALAAKLPVQLHPFPYRSEFSPRGLWELLRLVDRHSITLLHAHTGRTPTLAGAVRVLRPRVRLVVHRRVDFSVRGNPLRHWKYGLPDRIICISEGIRRILLRDGLPADKLVVIPSGIDTRRFSPRPASLREELGLPADEVVFGSLGELTQHKGYAALIDALALLHQEGREPLVLHAGKGALAADLQAQAQAAGLSRLHWLGWREDPERVLATLDVYLQPSLEEGLGTAILDAMACALPVIASHTGGIPEAVLDGETGLLTPPAEPQLLAEAMRTLAGDAALRQQFGQAGRSRAEALFDVRYTAERTLALYRELLE